ncbi:uncharacterized protein isoform X1 [Choristoneura fumiferana]|uniref:uncharacterized protein isoform X1 n=1 Tax=Choristoneura fumiferana TaxID=7141 RepID=UPI003D15D7DA
MFKALCAEVVPLLPPKLNSRGIDPTIKICDDMNSILNVDASYSGATHDSFMWQNGELRNFRKHFENLCSTHERAALLGRALEVSAGRAAAAPRARDGAGRVLGSRAEPLTGKALPKSDAAPSAPAGPAITAAADAMQRAREDRDRLIRDLKRR